jgi:aquaporin Z
MIDALFHHWPEYLIEGALLGIFMISACFAVFVMEHPASPVPGRIRSAAARRVFIGILMGVTAVILIYSPWGQRSGAHMNPGTTLTFLVLGKIRAWDAVFYIAAQFAGGFGGVLLSSVLLGSAIRHQSVHYVTTMPGKRGAKAAWFAEFAISLGMMGMVLLSTNHTSTAAYTGVFAGVLVASYVAIEAPLSGMSINPARTLASAVPARSYRGLWIYFTAPPLAMLSAAGIYTSILGEQRVYCAKLNHAGHERCIFDCHIDELRASRGAKGGIQSASGDSPR